MPRVHNVHERPLRVPAAVVAPLLDGLASPGDALWPSDRWWPQRFDRGLVVGAKGGHGPVKYRVEAHEPGERVEYRFPPRGGFDGTHGFRVVAVDADTCVLQHTLTVRTYGRGVPLWWLIRPLHDALIEDALDNAERVVHGHVARPARHGAYVRMARRFWLHLD